MVSFTSCSLSTSVLFSGKHLPVFSLVSECFAFSRYATDFPGSSAFFESCEFKGCGLSDVFCRYTSLRWDRTMTLMRQSPGCSVTLVPGSKISLYISLILDRMPDSEDSQTGLTVWLTCSVWGTGSSFEGFSLQSPQCVWLQLSAITGKNLSFFFQECLAEKCGRLRNFWTFGHCCFLRKNWRNEDLLSRE